MLIQSLPRFGALKRVDQKEFQAMLRQSYAEKTPLAIAMINCQTDQGEESIWVTATGDDFKALDAFYNQVSDTKFNLSLLPLQVVENHRDILATLLTFLKDPLKIGVTPQQVTQASLYSSASSRLDIQFDLGKDLEEPGNS